jgi:trehalose-6-phosphate synthase
LCVEPSDISSISQAFKKCIDMSEEARNDLIKNNQVLSETLFNRDIVLKKINNIVN